MKAPHFWSAGLDPYAREAAPLTRALLTPVSKLYSFVTAQRITHAAPFMCSVPVICIGNITAGGSGKTPIVKALRDAFSDAGIRTATLSRGYGGKEQGPLKVDAGLHTAKDVGDEPCMLAGSGESWIARDRPEGARGIASDGAQLIIMDDGHQNPSLHKDVSLLVIDASAPFGNGFIIPKGPLREPVSAALSRADGVIMMGTGETPSIINASGLPIIRATLKQTSPMPTGPLIAFAGIGRPERFFDSLRHAGADLLDTQGFADHYSYRPSDLDSLRERAALDNAKLVTTEKDYVRLPKDQRADIYTIPVEAVFSDIQALMGLLRAKLEDRLT